MRNRQSIKYMFSYIDQTFQPFKDDKIVMIRRCGHSD